MPRISPSRQTSLYDLCCQAEDERHAHRMKQLARMRKQLDALQAHQPVLQQHGIDLHPDQITLYTDGLFLVEKMFDTGARRLLSGLVAAGFKVAARIDHGSFISLAMRQGRLQVRLHVSHAVMAEVVPA